MLGVIRIGAILLMLVGGTFLAQGLRLLPSALMYGSPFWATVGAVLLLLGLGLAYRGFLRPQKRL